MFIVVRGEGYFCNVVKLESLKCKSTRPRPISLARSNSENIHFATVKGFQMHIQMQMKFVQNNFGVPTRFILPAYKCTLVKIEVNRENDLS